VAPAQLKPRLGKRRRIALPGVQDILLLAPDQGIDRQARGQLGRSGRV
jgi:hypothetical protein